jgi:hypothetical protein
MSSRRTAPVDVGSLALTPQFTADDDDGAIQFRV